MGIVPRNSHRSNYEGTQVKWIRNLFGRVAEPEPEPTGSLKTLQNQFSHFLSLLEHHNQVLKVMSDMEEKAQGDFLFDINYIRTSLTQIRGHVRSLVESMIDLGGQPYLPLKDRYLAIRDRIEMMVPGMAP
ncbi:hypothetical protein GF377_00045, partial [candidate division GN15 bacterium]|nr:hypothetical protein [candidate division GN15 bacterium]